MYTDISCTEEYRSTYNFVRVAQTLLGNVFKPKRKVKYCQGSHGIRELSGNFDLGQGNFTFFLKSGKSQCILSSDFCWQCFLPEKTLKSIFQSYALVLRGQVIYALRFVILSKRGTYAGSNACRKTSASHKLVERCPLQYPVVRYLVSLTQRTWQTNQNLQQTNLITFFNN